MAWGNRKTVRERTGNSAPLEPRVTASEVNLSNAENVLSEQERTTKNLVKGTNIIDSKVSSITSFTLEGRTLLNLVGDGRMKTASDRGVAQVFDKFEGVGSDGGNQKLVDGGKYGEKAQEVTRGTGIRSVRQDLTSYAVPGKRFLVRIDSKGGGGRRLTVGDRGYSGQFNYATNVIQSSSASWEPLIVLVSIPAEKIGLKNVVLSVEVTTNNSTAVFDGLAIYDLTEEQHRDAAYMSVEDLNKLYPYVEGAKHIENPFLIKKGRNLLPPLYEWTNRNNQVIDFNAPYEATVSPTSNNNNDTFVDIPAIPGQSYVIQGEIESTGNFSFAWRFHDSSNRMITMDGYRDVTRNYPVIFTPPAPLGAVKIRCQIYNNSSASGQVANFKNLMVSLGVTELPFEPQNDDVQLIKAKLGSTLDGIKKDIVYKKEDRYFLRELISKELTFDGSENWTKRDTVRGLNLYSLNVNEYPNYNQIVGVDHFTGYFKGRSTPEHISTISNYNHFRDGVQRESITLFGALTTGHRLIYIAVDRALEKDDLKTFLSNNPLVVSWELASPLETEIDVEGAIGLQEGKNLIEVDSGIVIREEAKADHYFSTGENKRYYGINNVRLLNGQTNLKYKAEDILFVYKNGEVDDRFEINTHVNANGRVFARVEEQFFDTSAKYTVTYRPQVSDYSSAPIEAFPITFNSSFKSSVNSLVQSTSELETKVSINTIQLYDILLRIRAGGL